MKLTYVKNMCKTVILISSLGSVAPWQKPQNQKPLKEKE